MAIRSVKDIVDAYSQGRVHTQRFYKSASTTGDTNFIDWSFAAGQPAYDARIGTSLTFTQAIASGNDSIFIPSITSGLERRLAQMELVTSAGATNQASVDAVVYDLLGYYPLIDGDSTDEQLMVNTLTLPRYTDGVGVKAVIVNHVAPMVSSASGTLKYVNTDDVEQTISFGVGLTGQNKVCSQMNSTTSVGQLTLPLASGDKGVKAINSIQFTGAPGGLFCIYLIKTLTTITNNDGSLVAGSKSVTEKDFCALNGFMQPVIYDGAHLGMFIRPNGGTTTVSMFGNMTFIWG